MFYKYKHAFFLLLKYIYFNTEYKIWPILFIIIIYYDIAKIVAMILVMTETQTLLLPRQ